MRPSKLVDCYVIAGSTGDHVTRDLEMTTPPLAEHRPQHSTTFLVDGEPVSTNERALTPAQIMGLAHVDPASNYLVRVEGRHQTSYKDRPNDKIEVHEDEVFVTVSTGPTPVS